MKAETAMTKKKCRKLWSSSSISRPQASAQIDGILEAQRGGSEEAQERWTLNEERWNQSQERWMKGGRELKKVFARCFPIAEIHEREIVTLGKT